MKKLRGIVFAFVLTPFFLTACGNKQKPIIPPYQADISLLTYDTTTVEYDLPVNLDNDSIVIESSDESLFTIKDCFPEGSRVVIESNLNNKVGIANLNFVEGEEVVYSLSVAVNYPQNIDQARDAFTLAAIKCEPNSEFSVTFNFHNKLNEEDFELSQEIYGRSLATNFVSYGKDVRENRFRVNTDMPYARVTSGMTLGDEYYCDNPNNINYLNHKSSLQNSHEFYIDNVERTLDVDNSEELFWAVEHGYRPIIAQNSSVLSVIYDSAKQICSDNINPTWSPFEKFRILFEALEQKTHYDYWLLDQAEYAWWEYKSYFLEGVFNDDGKAVCDGFAKAYALLCGIEGLPCIRSYGFGDDGGHAWNYINLDNNWYLACPTWCKMALKTPDEKLNNLMVYEAFAASKNYFSDLGSGFTDLAFTTFNKSESKYRDNILSLDKTSDTTSFLVENDNDANQIATTISNNIIPDKENYLSFSYKSSDDSKAERWISKMISGSFYSSYVIYRIGETDTSSVFSYNWLYFIPKTTP